MTVNIQLKQMIDNSYQISIDKLKSQKFNSKVAIITNPKVAGLHLSYLLKYISAKELYIITIADGEEFKKQETVDMIMQNLFNHKFNRSSILIAFGGGVVGDITGFVASIYQRGIEFIQIPTTLLSQVDASVGGKTGINNKFGKNLIGAFHQPKHVYIDIHFLSTLQKREFSAGMAEIIKMAVTFNKEFFNWLQTHNLNEGDNLKTAIKKAVETKAAVVSQDEKEKGIRAALNYGHTFAHVIENETNYTQYLHGEAVAIGMVMANKLAVKLSLMTAQEADLIKILLQSYDLPTSYKVKNIETFYEAFFLDKKSTDEKIKFILPKHIGNVEIKNDINKATLLDVLNGFMIHD